MFDAVLPVTQPPQPVFRLALRQTEGLIASIIRLLGVNLPTPDHTTLSRLAAGLEVLPRSLGPG